MTIDWASIVASIATVILGIAAVTKFIGKIIPSAVKYSHIAKDALDLIDDVIESLKDGKLTTEEINEIKNHALALKDDFKNK